jgi:hypothetical protein
LKNDNPTIEERFNLLTLHGYLRHGIIPILFITFALPHVHTYNSTTLNRRGLTLENITVNRRSLTLENITLNRVKTKSMEEGMKTRKGGDSE